MGSVVVSNEGFVCVTVVVVPEVVLLIECIVDKLFKGVLGVVLFGKRDV